VSGDEQLAKGRSGAAQRHRGRKLPRAVDAARRDHAGIQNRSTSASVPVLAKVGPPLALGRIVVLGRYATSRRLLPRGTPCPVRRGAGRPAAAPSARSSSRSADGRCASTDTRNSSPTFLLRGCSSSRRFSLSSYGVVLLRVVFAWWIPWPTLGPALHPRGVGARARRRFPDEASVRGSISVDPLSKRVARAASRIPR